MSTVGQIEKMTQARVVALFRDRLGYAYLGNWIDSFPDNYQWSNATSITKGMAPYGAVALGEIDQVVQRLHARAAEPDAWWQEWTAMGRRIERAADLRPALERALEGRRPTVLDVPMTNDPVPTAGHWDINDIYRW